MNQKNHAKLVHFIKLSSKHLPTIVMLKPLFFATRPQTYPLAIASILYAQSMAYRQLGDFSTKNWLIFILTLSIALMLQIISNLANDYGDGIKGVDNYRAASSPKRAIASGALSPQVLKNMLRICSLVTLVLGLALLLISINEIVDFLLFLVLGAMSILAAFAYTMGKYPYGYWAMGELFVLVFFGYVAVFGGYYLQVLSFTDRLVPLFWLASGAGLLCACILYINNMRDVLSDAKSQKITLATLLKKHMTYGYIGLFVMALSCFAVYGWCFQQSVLWFLIGIPYYAYHLFMIHRWRYAPVNIGRLLKPTVLMVLILSLFINLMIIKS